MVTVVGRRRRCWRAHDGGWWRTEWWRHEWSSQHVPAAAPLARSPRRQCRAGARDELDMCPCVPNSMATGNSSNLATGGYNGPLTLYSCPHVNQAAVAWEAKKLLLTEEVDVAPP